MNTGTPPVGCKEAETSSGSPAGITPVRDVSSRIAPPSQELRDYLRTLPSGVSARRHARSLCPVFDTVEAGSAAVGPSHSGSEMRIAFWNAERCKFLDETADLIRAAGVDAVLLAEMDRGMARSGNRHTPRDLADRLGWSYLYGVEFVELGLGDSRERNWHRGAGNDEGLHGNAILSRFPLRDPVLLRLDDGATWFEEPADGQRRVGGRMALGARFRLAGRDIALVAVHVESRSGPAERARQIGLLLDAVDAAYPDTPVLIGGDFNTCTLVRPGENTAERRQALVKKDASRFVRPVPFEPLFAAAETNGYDWQACNRLGCPTQRTRPDGTPAPPLGKLDWFLTRGLEADDTVVLPALAPNGLAISDHDMIVVSVRLPEIQR